MPCNDLKRTMELYVSFYDDEVFGSHLITQIRTSSHFAQKGKNEKDEKFPQCFHCHNFLSLSGFHLRQSLMHSEADIAAERESLKIENNRRKNALFVSFHFPNAFLSPKNTFLSKRSERGKRACVCASLLYFSRSMKMANIK